MLNVQATISKDFSKFLIKEYGEEVEKLIARRDLGSDGSFGGGQENENRRAKRRPIIFVHGLTNVAGTYEYIRRFFLKNGYNNSELYATTYSFGVRKFLRDKMECKHIVQIRLLIEAVSRYKKSNIDLVAYSMGSPMARKAVLGGICVDTGQYLGLPLTNLVHTFIGVAGANRDAEPLCKLLSWAEPCNQINGFSCNSAFLRDINSNVGYEAFSRISVIRSVDDTIVGDVACDGQSVSSINGQNDEIVLKGYSHPMAIYATQDIIYRIIQGLRN
ncbi:hypothetical protein ACQ4LE_000834 [Meloidogyne hapla]